MEPIGGYGYPHNGPSELDRCADCSAENPSWASINKGVLLCNDCCSVHRNLGRHISHIRSIKKGLWDAQQLDLVYLLHRTGSNRVWEYALLDPSSSSKFRKPTANDPILPIKENFISSKYVNHTFSIKNNKSDEVNQDDLNKQLLACVRTAHVDTTMRLLALGASANYIDPSTKNSPLHVAAKEGQAMQVELLCVHGADPEALNAADCTPADVAEKASHHELANRLNELRFELTNRLSLFLCGKKPNHKGKQHFLIPELAGESVVEGLRPQRRKLQGTSDVQLTKLAEDVYDEAERRAAETAWLSLAHGRNILSGNEQCVAMFLPLNPAFSSTRNQLRQKLAKYDVREFAALVIDILKEVRRRFMGEALVEEPSGEMNDSMHNIASTSRASGNERDYDDVADLLSSNQKRTSGATRSSGNKTRSSDSLDQSDMKVSIDDVLELRERQTDSEAKIQTLTSTSQHILKILSQLQSHMDHLRFENESLKNEVGRLNEQLTLARRLPSPITAAAFEHDGRYSDPRAGSRQSSRPPLQSRPSLEQRDSNDSVPRSEQDRVAHAKRQHPPRLPRDIVTASRGRDRSRESAREKEHRDIDIPSEGEYATVSPPPSKIQEVFTHQGFPDNLVRETDKLTVAIRELLLDAKHQTLYRSSSAHAHKIALLINQIVHLIPPALQRSDTEAKISTLRDATVMLSAKCNAPTLDSEEVCRAAYGVAQGAKMLLIEFSSGD